MKTHRNASIPAFVLVAFAGVLSAASISTAQTHSRANNLTSLPNGIWAGERHTHSSTGSIARGKTSIQISNNWIIEHSETEGGYQIDELWGLRFRSGGRVELLSSDKKKIGDGTCAGSSCVIEQVEKDARTQTRIFFGTNDISIYECGEVDKVAFCRHSVATRPEAAKGLGSSK